MRRYYSTTVGNKMNKSCLTIRNKINSWILALYGILILGLGQKLYFLSVTCVCQIISWPPEFRFPHIIVNVNYTEVHLKDKLLHEIWVR